MPRGEAAGAGHWTRLIPEEDRRRSRAAGFGRASGWGSRPALLVIDVQYRTTGRSPQPFWDAVEQSPTSCGEAAWSAVDRISALLHAFRDARLPVVFPHVAPKGRADRGRLAEKVPAIMSVAADGYEFVEEVAPLEEDILVPKRHPSAFFGTSLVSHLVDLGVDTLVFTGCTTSGCVRASVVDAFSYNFKVVVAEDAVYDRSPLSHAVNLFDISEKYGDVLPASAVVEALARRSQPPPEAQGHAGSRG